MEKVELVERGNCPLCGSRNSSVHINFPDIPINLCKKCGFLYSSMLMSEHSLNSYYQNNFGSARHQQGQIVNAKINAWAIQKLLKLNHGMTLLDIGTGYGFFIKELRDRYGVNVTGVELSEQEANYGSKNMGLDIRNSTLAKSNLGKELYDAVTCFEVIEHVPNPRLFVNEIVEHIKPGGYLFIMTDNFESKNAKSLGAGFPKWIPHSHISHFSPKTFEGVIEAAGLKIIQRMSFTPWELVARDCYYQLRGIQKGPEEAFKLSHVLETEMASSYRLFHLRKIVNKIWARITSRNDLEGALMYILARREPPPI
jgi:2-polyprenyl-3-methyl-5-hydroxy-6-metoxy-1,4-benzoquinol methylase